MELPEETLQSAKVLMVGAGGIGCELLKTLVLTGFKDIHLIDMDTIEVSNLNRQFLFRKRHVGQSKAKVAREAVLRFRPGVNIVAHHANVKDPQFNVNFFRQFNVVLNGLDNLDARRHVNRLCLAAGVPLVESGTTGYLGQVTVHIKGRTECYECQPKPAPKTYPICTITSTPSKPVHCIVWGKELPFVKLFGDKNQANDLILHTKDSDTENNPEDEEPLELQENEDTHSFARRVFDSLFGHNIELALKNEDAWKTRRPPVPLYIDKILPGCVDSGAGKRIDPSEESLSAAARLGLKNPQEVWTVEQNARVFLESVRLFLEARSKEIGTLTFDKDDQLAVEFVTAAANLRAHSFGIPLQSLFDAKGIAGNIIHAIATTNAIIAGLIVLEATKLLKHEFEHCRMTYCVEHPTQKKLLLYPVEPGEANPKCYVCSQTMLHLEVNTLKATLRDVVERIVKGKLGVNSPVVIQGTNILYETGDDLEDDEVLLYSRNLEKVVSKLPTPLLNGTVFWVEDAQQDFKCSIQVKHRDTFDEEKEPDGMVLSKDVPTTAGKAPENVANGTKAPDSAVAKAQDEDDDLVIVDASAAAKRKREETEGRTAQKQFDVGADVHVDKRTRLNIE